MGTRALPRRAPDPNLGLPYREVLRKFSVRASGECWGFVIMPILQR